VRLARKFYLEIIMRFLKSLAAVFLSMAVTTVMSSEEAIEIDKTATIKDTKTTIMGINHIGLSVKNLDQALAFYQQATGFEVIKREKVYANNHSDTLYAGESLEYEVATLKAPNMLFELTEFAINKDVRLSDMLAQGPGITHTCFQSPKSDSGYAKFVAAGTRLVTPGNGPVDLGGYGVTYAYGYDPEGNMFEMEELDGKILERGGYDDAWQELDHSMWMTQVAFATPDIEKLMRFYQDVLGIKPYRKSEIIKNSKIDRITNLTDTDVLAGWFKMDGQSKMMEFWQFRTPKTEVFTGKRKASDLGYSYSLEVTDIQKEYQRLKSLGVDLISAPQQVGGFWQMYARDVDGNIFSLRQVIEANSNYSIVSFDKPE
jgi:catechol 2,3-dioxygenase-like lactoylglutathione lyase family enzyme